MKTDYFFLGFVVVSLVGWLANIFKLALIVDSLTGLTMVRIAGIFFPPLGAVMGFL